MKATVENIINTSESDLNNFEFSFDWMLLKYGDDQYECKYSETTFYPEYQKSYFKCNKQDLISLTRKIAASPIYKKMIDSLRKSAEKWFEDHEIYSGKIISFCSNSPEGIKNDICFLKILPYVDPTKLEVIDLKYSTYD